MAMDKELLEILACPKCKGELQLTVDERARFGAMRAGFRTASTTAFPSC